MPPKVQTSAARRGRPAKVAAPESAIPVAVMVPPKKRGRPAKADTVETVTVESPKKRGRPAKTQVNEPIAQIDSAIKRGRRSLAAAEEAVAEAQVPKKRAGRPAKAETIVAEEAVAPKKRAGRPRKEDVAPATPKRRGRPALDLNRVAGSPRVAKRTSPHSKPVARAPKVAAAPRINPKMRSRLRHRAAPVEKVKKEIAQPVKKARGRPKKIEVEAPAPKKAVGRKDRASASAVTKTSARPKTAAPRKRRGYTAFEVPDKFAAQVKQLVSDLQAADAANAAAAAGEADDEEEGVELEVELGPEEGDSAVEETEQFLADQANERFAQEEGGSDAAEQGEKDVIDPADVARAAGLTQNALLGESADANAELARDDFEDETELPSETAVRGELDVQDAIQDNVQAANERENSSSDVSVDVHQEITEVSSIPQIDGTNEVDVFHTHVDTHAHVHEHAHPTELVAGPAVGSLFGGL